MCITLLAAGVHLPLNYSLLAFSTKIAMHVVEPFPETNTKFLWFMDAQFNSLWPSNALWWHSYGSTLAQVMVSLQWWHNGRDGVTNHRRLNCLLNRLFRRKSQKASKPCVSGLCEGNSPVTGEFPAQNDSNAENFSIWWRHHVVARRYQAITWTNLHLL